MIDALVALGVFVAAFFARLNSLGSHYFQGVLPHRYSRAWQRQHWHHERHAHDGQKGRRRGILARFRQRASRRASLAWVRRRFLTGSFVTYETLFGIATMGCTLGHIFSHGWAFTAARASLWPLAHCSCLGACGGMYRAVRHFCRARRAYALCFGGFHRIRGAVPGYRMLPVLGRLGRYRVLFRHGHDGCVGPSWQH